ncbi:hypothetical protein ASE37_24440 [Rhizobium sp. Root268]|nr:hypothetical protein ASC86_24240 [Rhizobium sp. Root1212]KRD28044.1 hypothetical protein ASE37_24440 [Rhizobium sp. Root268]
MVRRAEQDTEKRQADAIRIGFFVSAMQGFGLLICWPKPVRRARKVGKRSRAAPITEFFMTSNVLI